ncbi:uncharacterized protein LOC127278493 [Leptopilina boulardi]|uniref:uncharacterized protein LOC127278493 n=1 Tax=Leptopilina boulardi TaxID=63433 RepID=UPI0021F587D9|nr:uncharacterized protein LOC127278493 [Leptopilina boulardi]
MSDRSCSQCNANIAGEASSCPCGAFYHPGCFNLSISKSTGRRKCCPFKPSQRSLSPTAPPLTLESISNLLDNHYVKAKKDSEEFITKKLDAIQNDFATLSTALSSHSERLDNALERIENLELQVSEIQSTDNACQHIDSGLTPSQVFSEISDRIQRKQNLILFGCPEVHVDEPGNTSSNQNIICGGKNKDGYVDSLLGVEKDRTELVCEATSIPGPYSHSENSTQGDIENFSGSSSCWGNEFEDQGDSGRINNSEISGENSRLESQINFSNTLSTFNCTHITNLDLLNDLLIYYQNVRGLNTKLSILSSSLDVSE